MNISIENKLFSSAVHTVSRFAEKKNTTLQALSAILIVAGDEGIKLRATNLEVAIDFTLAGTCHSKGVVAIPATIIQQIASTLPQEGQITIEQTGEVATLITSTGKSIIKTVPYDDFPSIPLPEDSKNKLTVSGAVIRSLFNEVANCASPSTIRPELASIYMKIEGGDMTLVATDSFRLVEKKVPLTSHKGLQGSLLIPAKNALDITQALTDDEITIVFDEHQCAFHTKTSVLVSRLTNATYPDYQQIIPKDKVVSAVILRKDFDSALKRVTVFSDSFQKIKISFDVKQKKFSLFGHNNDIGEATETIPQARLEGEPLDLSFNYRYLSTCLSLFTSEQLEFSAAGIGRPLLVRGVGDATTLYLISPMNQ